MKWHVALVAVLWSGALWAQSDSSFQIKLDMEKYTLDNGLVVILHKDDSVPLVSYNVWFRVGSRHERPGITGIAHTFEHLMFKGTERYPEGEFDKLLHSSGATSNAFTSHDYTGYYEIIPPGALELVMDLESDRMRNLKLTPEVLASEREVVKEERRQRVDNVPTGRLREHLFATLFKVHPYRWPVIGWMEDISSYTLDDLKAWYETYYAPNNAVLVIAGSINIPQTKKWVEKYYGKMEAKEIPKTEKIVEPEPRGFVSSGLRAKVQAATVALAYPTVPAGHEDAYALDMLAQILGEGDSSRIHQRLVYRTQMATSAGAYHYTPQEAGIFQVSASLKPGLETDGVRTALLGEVYRLRNQDVEAAELEKAKAQIAMSTINSLKTIHGKASSLAINEIYFEDPLRFLSDLERYNALTAEDLKRVAGKYLTPQRARFVVLRPNN